MNYTTFMIRVVNSGVEDGNSILVWHASKLFTPRHSVTAQKTVLPQLEIYNFVGGKGIPVTGCGSPQGYETLRFPHFLDSWLTDGGKNVSRMHWPHFTPRKIPGTHFC
jgi:hypothetical protein